MTDGLCELYTKATPRPWEVDSERDTDGPDRHTYYKMFGPDGKVLFDTLNSDVIYLHTEYDSDETGSWENVWDEQGRANFALVAHAVNNIEAHEATITQLRDHIARLFDAIKHGDEQHQIWLREAIVAHFGAVLTQNDASSLQAERVSE